MKSALPKVLHKIAGLPLLAHVVRGRARPPARMRWRWWSGMKRRSSRQGCRSFAPAAETFVQQPRLGTAHAALAAREAIARGYDDVLVMFGDTPLIDADVLSRARARLAEGNAVVVVGFRTPEPDRLWPADRRGRRAGRHPRGEGLHRRGAAASPSAMAASWRSPAQHALPLLDQVSQRQCQGRILPHRHRRDCPRRPGLASSPSRRTSRTCSASTRCAELAAGRGDLAAAPPARGDARRRDAGGARDGVLLRTTPRSAPDALSWSRTSSSARASTSRPARSSMPSATSRAPRSGRAPCRPVRAAASRRRSRRGRQGRQFLRGEEGDRSRRAPRSTT